MKRRSIVWTLALLTAAVVGVWARQQMAIESRDQPATADDLRILRRADALLGDASVWNRHDDRVCDDDEAGGKRSLFCALQKAAREILGEYQHRNVALQEVRFAIQDATRDRQTEMATRTGLLTCDAAVASGQSRPVRTRWATSQDQSVQPRYAATWRGVCRSAY